jgi:hypothetical protein
MSTYTFVVATPANIVATRYMYYQKYYMRVARIRARVAIAKHWVALANVREDLARLPFSHMILSYQQPFHTHSTHFMAHQSKDD